MEHLHLSLAADQHLPDTLIPLFIYDANLVGEVLPNLGDLLLFYECGSGVLLNALAAEDPDVDDEPLHPRWNGEGRVSDITGLFSEDGFQQFLLGRKHGLALGSNLAHENVARPHMCTDPYDAAFIEIQEHLFADVRNVSGNLLLALLRIPSLDFKLLDVDRGEEVLSD